MIHVEILRPSVKTLQPFIQLPFDIYQDDGNWVPPVRKKLVDSLLSPQNELLTHSEHQYFLAFKGEEPIARVLAGVDKTQQLGGQTIGWFSLFDCEDDIDGARAVMDAASAFLKEQGAERIIGPVAPMYDLLNRGLLVEGYDRPPVLGNPYNKRYYPTLLSSNGFEKARDYLAYDIAVTDVPLEKMLSLKQRVEQRFRFRVEEIPAQRIGLRLAREIAQVIAAASDPEKEYVPTEDDILQLLERMRPVYRSELCVMAYSGDQPIGVVLAFPDNTKYLQTLGGYETPLRLLKAMLTQKSVKTLRCPMQSVVPAFQNKAVNMAMICHAVEGAVRLGFTHIEGSTVAEDDASSTNNTLMVGGKPGRVYRVYSKEL